MSDWQPTVSLPNLVRRAQLLRQTRQFFSSRDVLEVETPLACAHTVTEPSIESFSIPANGALRYLQTSPEYAMKRLLAAGAPDIYQICKSFRDGEKGYLHNPEFTMIEWYRHGFSLEKMMQETVDLIVGLLAESDNSINVDYVSYHDLTKKMLGRSLNSLSENEVKQLAKENGLVSQSELSMQQCIDFLFSHKVESAMCEQSITVVFHYPARQAALSKLNDSDNSVSERYEVFYKGLELANGYVELLDPEQQHDRFINDQQVRKEQGSLVVDIDQRLLDAQRHGLPECAGVAIGFDRVLMLALGVSSISQVMSFDWDNA